MGKCLGRKSNCEVFCAWNGILVKRMFFWVTRVSGIHELWTNSKRLGSFAKRRSDRWNGKNKWFAN